MATPIVEKIVEKPLGTNWKTNAGAVAAVMTAVAAALTAYQNGTLDSGLVLVAITALVNAWIGFSAKDANVTGGTKQQ